MSADKDEIARRIDKAAEDGKRAKETAEFLKGLTSNDELIRNIVSPEAWILRDKAQAAAKRGEIKQTKCTHPMRQLKQFLDEDSSIGRNGRLVNLFECGVCSMLLWLRDPFGNDVDDS